MKTYIVQTRDERLFYIQGTFINTKDGCLYVGDAEDEAVAIFPLVNVLSATEVSNASKTP